MRPAVSVAVLADVHGNLPALSAVLAEGDGAAADAVVLLGDIDSPPERWEAVLAGLSTDIGVVVCGHTHMPFDRLAAGRRVINPGSVGMPYGPPGAHWALLGTDVRLRRTEYDITSAAEVITASRDPGGGQWAREYVLSHYSDAEALAAFTGIARQQDAQAC